MRKFEYEVTPMAGGLPTVTLGDVERAVVEVTYARLPRADGSLSTTTVCRLELDSGYSVIGESVGVVPEKFDAEEGRAIAFRQARDTVWMLLGYELRLKLNGSQQMQAQMNFGGALIELKAGKKVSRAGWNGKGLWLELQRPDAHSKMTLPYIFMSYPDDAKTTPGARVPWLASQTDMLAEDWVSC